MKKRYLQHIHSTSAFSSLAKEPSFGLAGLFDWFSVLFGDYLGVGGCGSYLTHEPETLFKEGFTSKLVVQQLFKLCWGDWTYAVEDFSFVAVIAKILLAKHYAFLICCVKLCCEVGYVVSAEVIGGVYGGFKICGFCYGELV